MKFNILKTTLLVAVLSFGMAGVSHAGFIVDGFQFDDGPNFADFLGLLDPIDNNDNADPDTEDVFDIFDFGESFDFNLLAIAKEFDTLDPVDFMFEVENSGGTTEYQFIEPIFNFTGTAWTDYHLELGFEREVEVAPGEFEGVFIPLSEFGEVEIREGVFVDATELGLDFDTPHRDPAPSAFYFEEFEECVEEDDDGCIDEETIFLFEPIFSTITHHDGAIWFEDPIDDGIFSFGLEDNPDIFEVAFITFSIDVPDLDLNESFSFGEGYEFMIRQYPSIDTFEAGGEGPVVPEPASMILLGSGLLGFAGLRKKRKI